MMENFGDVGLGLSIVFGFLLLALVAELYYLLWWKRRITSTQIHHQDEEDDRNYAKELLHLLCWKKPSLVENSSTRQINSSTENRESAVNGFEEPDLELGCCSKDLLLKNFGDESIEAELMRLHNLAGPPRFLFTINEETREDLESEDGKSKSRKGSRTRSLSDVMAALDRTPFLTPLSSPPRKAPPLEAYPHHGFNPLFESSTDTELNRLRSSPPPKFKFLRDAEEKLMRRLLEEAEKSVAALRNPQDPTAKSHAALPPPLISADVADECEGSFIRLIAGKNRGNHHQNPPQFHSGSSQVLPLCSSPSTFIPPK